MKVQYDDGTIRDEPDPTCGCGKSVVQYVLHRLDGTPDENYCQVCLFQEIPNLKYCMVSKWDPDFLLPLVDEKSGHEDVLQSMEWDEWEYDIWCRWCRTTVSTYSDPGTVCKCHRVSSDWMRNNRQTLYERSESQYNPSHVRKFRPNEAFTP